MSLPEALPAVLRPILGEHVAIDSLRALTGGASRTTWAFDAVTPDGRRAALNRGSVLLVQALLTLSVLFVLPINARLSNRTVSGGEWAWAGPRRVSLLSSRRCRNARISTAFRNGGGRGLLR